MHQPAHSGRSPLLSFRELGTLNYSCAGQIAHGRSVKREAGENPALSRSGDGSEKLHGARQALSQLEMGSGNGVDGPESEDRPAATATEALDADRGCAEACRSRGLEWQPLYAT